MLKLSEIYSLCFLSHWKMTFVFPSSPLNRIGFITSWRSSVYVSVVCVIERPFGMCACVCESESSEWAHNMDECVLAACPFIYLTMKLANNLWKFSVDSSPFIPFNRSFTEFTVVGKMYCSKENNEMCKRKMKMKMNVKNNRRGGKVYL